MDSASSHGVAKWTVNRAAQNERLWIRLACSTDANSQQPQHSTPAAGVARKEVPTSRGRESGVFAPGLVRPGAGGIPEGRLLLVQGDL
jgi:hypothetical protein